MKKEIVIELDSTWDLLSFSISREAHGCALDMALSYTKNDEKREVILKSCKDANLIESLLEAERVKFSKELQTQREYGTINIECFEEESYAEYCCDEIEITKL